MPDHDPPGYVRMTRYVGCRNVTDLVCRRCGALILNPTLHDHFHAALAEKES